MDSAPLGSEKDNLSLFVQNRKRLVDYATTVTGTTTQSEDIVQEAWVRFSTVSQADPNLSVNHYATYSALSEILLSTVDGHTSAVAVM